MGIKVLMVTGVYCPEINGAVLQCKQLVKNINNHIEFNIITGTGIKSLVKKKIVEKIPVTRVYMPKDNKFRYLIGMIHFIFLATVMIRKTDLVHIHGFSKRNAVVILIARILQKKVILKMTSFGQDDSLSVKIKSPFLWLIYKCCNVFIGVSPAFAESHKRTEIGFNKYEFIPNSVDINKFSSATADEKNELKTKFSYSENDKIILFIGHFSQEKRPLLLYQAWLILRKLNNDLKIIFIGRTIQNFEVDEQIVQTIRSDAIKRGILENILFIEQTDFVHEYLKIADVFVLPSIREGLPNVLLEAMSCALPCVVTNLQGVTDWLIKDRVTGRLLYSDQPEELSVLIKPLLTEYSDNREMGFAAQKFIQNEFSSEQINKKIIELYKRLAF